MSNFICSECGMTNIDCGHDGYKTPREIELEKKLNIAINSFEIIAAYYIGQRVFAVRESRKALKQIKEVK